MGIESAGLGFSVGLYTGIYEQSMDRLCGNGLSESDPSNLMHRTPQSHLPMEILLHMRWNRSSLRPVSC